MRLFRTHNVDDVLVIEFIVPGLSSNQALDELSDRLHEVVARSDSKKVIIDITKVSFLASPVLGVLITVSRFAESLKGKVIICGLRANLRQIFRFANIERLFTFHDTRDEAMAAMVAESKGAVGA